jgi:hypothetical protein
MEPDPLDLPTSPSLPMRSVRSPVTPWPDQAGGQPPQPPVPPSRRPPWPLLAIVGAGLAVVLIVALLLTLLLSARGGTTTVLLGAEEQTATSAQATSTAEGTPPTSPTGTAGSTGPRATATPHGATATSGTPATPSVHQVINQITLSGYGDGSVVATCPSGELALSGGWAVRYDSGATVYRSSRSGAGAWSVSVNHPSTALVTSYAECLKDAPRATIAERRAQVSLAANTAGAATAKCNAGEVVAGGGFVFDQHTEVGLDFFSNNASDTQWEGQALNFGSTAALASVYAECLASIGASMQATAFAGLRIAAGNQGSAYSGACPSGYSLSGGAYNDEPGGAFLYDLQGRLVLGGGGGSSFIWAASLSANDGLDTGLEVQAICLRF